MTDESNGDTAAGIAEIENTMRTDYRSYERDAGLQTRYRDLLSARNAAAPEARQPSETETEIAAIQNLMRTDFRAYQADPSKQSRFLELIQQRDAAPAQYDGPMPGDPSAAQEQAREVVSATPPEGHSDHGNGQFTALPVAEIMQNLEGVPEMAAMVKSWGGDAEANVAYLVRERNAILNSLPEADARELELDLESLSMAAQVKLCRHFADAGRAKATR